MKNSILYVVLSCLSTCYGQKLLEGCDYDNSLRTYYCKDITNLFPNQYYGKFHLECVNCDIIEFSDQTFPYRNDLISFNASGSGIERVGSKAFSPFTSSQYIYLQNNRINKISTDAFYGLSQLYELHLEHNKLKKLDQNFLNGLASNDVDLSHNEIEELINGIFNGVSNVLMLDLSYNKIHILNIDSFLGLDTLEQLDLRNNLICYLPLGVFKNLISLTSLNLSNNKLNTFMLGSFSGLKSLNFLNLANNTLSNFDGEFLLPLVRISILDISGNGIFVFDGNSVLDNAPTLRILHMADNLLSCGNLRNVVRYFRKNNIEISSYNEKYDVQNIFGIACTTVQIREVVPYNVFLLAAKEDAVVEQKIC